MISLILLLHALNALLCCSGYVLIATGRTRYGFLLSAVGSVGWMLAAPSIFFSAQSLVFLVGSVIGYERSKAR